MGVSNAVSVCNLLQDHECLDPILGVGKLRNWVIAGKLLYFEIIEGALPILYVQANPWILSPGKCTSYVCVG